MRTLYNILFLIFFVALSPYYFWRLRRRGNWIEGFGQRFASYDAAVKQALTNRHIIWLHAVSVGEIGLCTQLIRALEPRVPNAKIVVSCTTTTGMAECRRLPNRITKIYYPLDRRKFARMALATINPQAIVLLEAEIWPNFLWRAADLRIPVFLANARLSDRSYPRYKKFGWLFRPIFRSFAGVGCQNKEDAQKLQDVGCVPGRVYVTGNLKFDAGAKLTEQRSLDVRGLLRQIGVADDAPVLVAGSTHDGEEMLLAEMAARLRLKSPNLFLILVPRHFERSKDIGQQLRTRGVKFTYRNEILPATKLAPNEVECLLVDTTGELKFFYEPASVVFIGKSLTAIGGQNPIEPAALGKAVVFGPNMQNFKDIVRIFLSKDAAVQVQSPDELERTLAALLADPARRAELGRHALEVVAENLGAVERTVEMMLPHLAQRGILVVPKKV